MDTNDQTAAPANQITDPGHSHTLITAQFPQAADVGLVLTAAGMPVHGNPILSADLPAPATVASVDIAAATTDVAIAADTVTILPTQDVVIHQEGDTSVASVLGVAVPTGSSESTDASSEGAKPFNVPQPPLTVDLESTVNAEFLQQLRDVLDKHEEDVSARVDEIMAEKLKPVFDEFQEIREAVHQLAAPTIVIDPGHTNSFTGIQVTGPDPLKDIEIRIKAIERRLRGTC